MIDVALADHGEPGIGRDPHSDALGNAGKRGLAEAIECASACDRLCAVILTGAGGTSFIGAPYS